MNWDTSKDEALWKILSGVAKTEIDCEFSCILDPLYPASGDFIRSNLAL